MIAIHSLAEQLDELFAELSINSPLAALSSKQGLPVFNAKLQTLSEYLLLPETGLTGDELVSNGEFEAHVYYPPSVVRTEKNHRFIEAMIRTVMEEEGVCPQAENWFRREIRVSGLSVILIAKHRKYNLACTRQNGLYAFYVQSVEEFDPAAWDDDEEETLNEDHRGLEEYNPQWFRSHTFDLPDWDADGSLMMLHLPGNAAQPGDTLTLSECHLAPYLNGNYMVVDVGGDWVHIDLAGKELTSDQEIGFPFVTIFHKNRVSNIDWRPSVYDGEEWWDDTD